MSNHKFRPIHTFKRGLTVSPFQIPLLVYLFLEGLLVVLTTPQIAAEIGMANEQWVIYWFGAALCIGSFIATGARFTDNERWETTGLLLVLLAVILAVIIEVAIGDYLGLMDEIAVGAGAILRIRVLAKARKAQKVAIRIVDEENS